MTRHDVLLGLLLGLAVGLAVLLWRAPAAGTCPETLTVRLI